MAWVESASRSFSARHDAADARDARRVLETLELTRARMAEWFPRPLDEITVVLHRSLPSLALTNPLLPLAWLASAPAARRYVVGWAGRQELHVLAPALLRARASNVPGSREMLSLSAAALYARRAAVESNADLRGVMGLLRLYRELRWAWLLEGAGRWFSGQIEYARPAIATRLREGGPPRFPPGPRDATLLGATVIDLVARERGEAAAARLIVRLHPRGGAAALEEALERPRLDVEEAWRAHLSRLAGGG